MFLRPYYRRRHGKREAYWALVESYRTERGPRQRTVAYLGLMDEAGRLGVEQAADPQPVSPQRELFPQNRTKPRFVAIDVTQPDDHQKILLERLGLTLPGRLHKTDL
jgi:hypothetical protein